MDFKGLADLTWVKDAPVGSVAATFSTFGVVDRDGDVTLPSAFTDGSAVPMVWSHDWSRPVGKGVIRVRPDRAVFEGAFFLKTAWGADAYATVTEMGDLQEYSYGFQIKEAAPGVHDGQPVRVLKSLEVFEVSPVLVGAGVGTGTERIKSGGLVAALAEAKIGRRFSGATRRDIQTVIEALTALIADAEPESAADDEAAKILSLVTPEWLAGYRERYRLS